MARLLSPLQHLKAVIRIRSAQQARPGSNLRTDVPAFVTEIYFLISFAIQWLVYASGPAQSGSASAVILALTSLLTLETVTWLFYYLFVRAILERNYKTYHPAEYLIEAPLVLATQAFGIANSLRLPVGDVLDSLLGGEVVSGSIGDVLNLIALFYLTVGITTLVNSYPTITARPSDSLAIVGSGRVVRERVLPALGALNYKPWEISILTTDLTAPARLGGSRVIRGSSDELIRWIQA